VTWEWGYDSSPKPRKQTRPPKATAYRLDREKLARFAARKPTPDQWSAFFGVFTVPDSGTIPPDQPPLAGRYHVEANKVHFTPKYPVALGVTLRARLDPRVLDDPKARPRADGDLAGRVVLADFNTKDSIVDQPVTSIVKVSPSATELPENLLKFYIQFSAPMGRGEAYRHIRLLDSIGKPISDPFLELDEELWSPDGTRFTLLLDPGRIKRGLKPREEVGPVFEAGKSYALVIDASWPDALGNPLTKGFRRPFNVRPPDMVPPDPHLWKVSEPRGASRDPLVIRFPEPLDHALALRLITVRDSAGRPVKGDVELDEAETRFRLIPKAFWKPGGEYSLEVGTELEDLAGNSVGRPFEVDLSTPITDKVNSLAVSIPFRAGPAAK
jgi:hypothetical protein